MANKSFNVYCENRIYWWENQEEAAVIRVQNGNLHYYIPTFNNTSSTGFKNLNQSGVRIYSSGGRYHVYAGGRDYTVFPASYANLAGHNYDGIDINTFAQSDRLVLQDEMVKIKPTFWLRILGQTDIYAGWSSYNTYCVFQAGWNFNGDISCGKHFSYTDCYIEGSTTITVSNATDSVWGWLFNGMGTVSRTQYISKSVTGWSSPVYAYEMYRRYGEQMEEYSRKLSALKSRYGRFAMLLGYASSLIQLFGKIQRGLGSVFTGMIKWNTVKPVYTKNAASYYRPGMTINLRNARTNEVLAQTYFYPDTWKFYPYSFQNRFWW